jgi:hypothetical protein
MVPSVESGTNQAGTGGELAKLMSLPCVAIISSPEHRAGDDRGL